MIDQLLKWMDSSTCNLMAVDTIRRELDKAGFEELKPENRWELKPSGRYYMTKNGSAIFAFVAGTEPPSGAGFNIIASHSDSPTFKVKPNAEIYTEGIVKLNVEKYGGGILYTWFDRPLSMSGRVALRSDNPLQPEIRLVDLRKPVCTIPHLAIHFNRAVNEGNPLSVQTDMLPVLGVYSKDDYEALQKAGGVVKSLLGAELGVEPYRILDYELNLYPT